MAKKKKLQLPWRIIKYPLIMGLIFVLGFGVSQAVLYFLVNSPYFKVKTVILDPALDFISTQDFGYLKGKSIFEVDLKKLKSRIEQRHAQVSDLRVQRRFPNQILIMARRRMPFIQILLGRKILTCDERGVLLDADDKRENKLPLIEGLKFEDRVLGMGHVLRSQMLFSALEIVRYFYAETKLAGYGIERIYAANPAEIKIFLNDSLQIFVSDKNVFRQIQTLGIVLSSGDINPKEVKYIDLRYKEPLLKKK